MSYPSQLYETDTTHEIIFTGLEITISANKPGLFMPFLSFQGYSLLAVQPRLMNKTEYQLLSSSSGDKGERGENIAPSNQLQMPICMAATMLDQFIPIYDLMAMNERSGVAAKWRNKHDVSYIPFL